MPASHTTKEKYLAAEHSIPTPEIKGQDFVVDPGRAPGWKGSTASTTAYDWPPLRDRPLVRGRLNILSCRSQFGHPS